MSKKSTKRVILPDNIYNSVHISTFINYLMQDGKKSIAEEIFYSAISDLSEYVIQNKISDYEAQISIALREEEKKKDLVNFVFLDILDKLRPVARLKSKRVGGANYQVPSPVDERRGYALAIRWVIDAAQKRSGRSMIEKLAEELFDAANNRGVAIKKREDTHKMAEANKAFAHFAQRSQQQR